MATDARNMIRTHELKTWPVAFEAVWAGMKTFEIRLNDRFYQRGDHVVLLEFDPKADCVCTRANASVHAGDCPKYSGRKITADIGFVLANFPGRSGRGFNAGDYVVFSLIDTQNHDGRSSNVASIQKVLRASGTTIGYGNP